MQTTKTPSGNDDFKSGDRLMKETTPEMKALYDVLPFPELPNSNEYLDRGRYLNLPEHSDSKARFEKVFGQAPSTNLNRYVNVASKVQPETEFYNGTKLNIPDKTFLVVQGPTVGNPYNMEQYLSTLLQNDITDIMILGEEIENNKLKFANYIPKLEVSPEGVVTSKPYCYGVIGQDLEGNPIFRFTVERLDNDPSADGFDKPYKIRVTGPCLDQEGNVVIKTKEMDVYQMKIEDHMAANLVFGQLKKMAELFNNPSKKFAAHCSAGLGRSGLEGVIYAVLHTPGCLPSYLNDKDASPNIAKIVERISLFRKLRPGIVQHDYQLHMALRVAMQIKLYTLNNDNKYKLTEENFNEKTKEIDDSLMLAIKKYQQENVVAQNPQAQPSVQQSQQSTQQQPTQQQPTQQQPTQQQPTQPSSSSAVIATGLHVSPQAMKNELQPTASVSAGQSRRSQEYKVPLITFQSVLPCFDPQKNKKLEKWWGLLRQAMLGEEFSKDNSKLSEKKKGKEVIELGYVLKDNKSTDDDIINQILKLIHVSIGKHAGKSALAKNLTEMLLTKMNGGALKGKAEKIIFDNDSKKNVEILTKMFKYISNVEQKMQEQAQKAQHEPPQKKRKGFFSS